MKKILTILCYSTDECVAPVLPLLSDINAQPLVSTVKSLHEYGSIDSLLQAILKTAGFSINTPLPAGWGAQTQASFDAAISLYLDEFLAASDGRRYVAASTNAFFVDAWRSLCKRMGISARFVHIRNFSKLLLGTKASPLTIEEFNVSLAILRQVTSDVACFDVEDWKRSPTLANSKFTSIYTGSLNQAKLPAANLQEILQAAPSSVRNDIPVELVVIHNCFVGKHYGEWLILPNHAPILEEIENIARPMSALSIWLGLVNKQVVDKGELTVCATNFTPSVKGKCADLRAEFVEVWRQQQQMLDHLNMKLKENEAVHKELKAPADAVNAINKSGAVNPKAISPAKKPVATKTATVESESNVDSRTGRLWRKFKKNPVGFFADSKNPLLRKMGIMFWHR